jgi:HK97 gp10 family phage protein
MPFKYEVEFRGLDEQIKRLGRLDLNARRQMKQAMARSVLKLVSSIKPLTPVDTGRLRGSITGSIKVLGNKEVIGIASTRVNYAGFVEFGTKKMRPRRYMARGFRAARNQIKRYFAMAVKRMIRSLKVN